MSNWGELSQYIQCGNPNGRIIAIGDIHGCYHTLLSLLKKLNIDKTSDTLMFLGDYIDRGPFPYEVVDCIQSLQKTYHVICLRGNHEQFMVDNECLPNDIWERNGGATTIYSYKRNAVDPVSHIRWMESLPLVYETPKYIFCHAGLSRPKLLDNDANDILWDRQWMREDPLVPREKPVIFGHTPDKRNGARKLCNGDLCMDGGCVFGGMLCAIVLDGDSVEIKSVPLHDKDEELCPWAW